MSTLEACLTDIAAKMVAYILNIKCTGRVVMRDAMYRIMSRDIDSKRDSDSILH